VCCGLELTDEVVANITEYNFTCSLCLSAAAAPKKSGRVRTPKKREEAPQTLAAASGDALTPKGGKAASGGGGKSASNKMKAAPRADAANSGGGKKAKFASGKGASGAASPTPATGASSSSSSSALSSTRDGRGTSSQQVSVYADEAAINAALRPDRSMPALGEGEYVEESIMVVEKFLGRKKAAPPEPETGLDEEGLDADGNAITTTTTTSAAAAATTAGGAAVAAAPVEWYLVKWRGLSHLHLSWEVAADIEAVDLAGRAKLRRWLATNPPLFDETTPEGTAELAAMEFFEPEAIECQVVLACDHDDPLHARGLGRPKNYRAVTSSSKGGKNSRGSKGRGGAAALAASSSSRSSSGGVAENPDAWWDENDAEDEVKYLVKWRGLPFEAATWEEWGLIKPDAHAQVKRFWAKERQPPNRELERRPMPPEIKLYKRLLESPLFGLMPGEESSYSVTSPQKKPVTSSSPPLPEAASDAIVSTVAAEGKPGAAAALEVGAADGIGAVAASVVGTVEGLAAATAAPQAEERALVEVEPSSSSAAAAGASSAALELEPTVMEVDDAPTDPIKGATAAGAASAVGGGEGIDAMQEDLSGATTTVVAADDKAPTPAVAGPVDDDAAAVGLRLREYQLEGVNWLVWNWYNSRPSILADEM